MQMASTVIFPHFRQVPKKLNILSIWYCLVKKSCGSKSILLEYVKYLYMFLSGNTSKLNTSLKKQSSTPFFHTMVL